MQVENSIVLKLSSENKKQLENIIESSETLSGRFCQTNFWKIKRKLLPRPHDPPMAKKDLSGNLITSKSSLKKLYLETYKRRLCPAAVKGYTDLFEMRSQLWTRRNILLKTKISEPWNINYMEKTLKDLKTNKSRDPHGLLNELFKEGCIGANLKDALLILFNKIKKQMVIPNFMTLSNITTIYKCRGSPEDMDNDRGIFFIDGFKKSYGQSNIQ